MSLAFFDPMTALEKIKNQDEVHSTYSTNSTKVHSELNLSSLSTLSNTIESEKCTLQKPPQEATTSPPPNVHLLAGYVDPKIFWRRVKEGALVPCPHHRWWWIYKNVCNKCRRPHHECIMDFVRGSVCA